MTPTIATLLDAASRAAQDHEKALAARQATHEQYARQRAAQPPATTPLAPWPPSP